MLEIKVTIQGVTPLLLNRFTDEPEGADSGEEAPDKNSSPKEHAEYKLYKGMDGKTLVVPGPNIFRMIIDAGAFFKMGKKTVTTAKSSLIPSFLSLEEVEVPIVSKDGWQVDTRPVRIPSTGGRILRHRPCFHDWALSFTLELDTAEADAHLIREIVDKAGKAIGMGDFRPACKGPFGKFVVVDWKTKKC